MGNVDIAIIEACEVTADGKIYLTAAGGIAPTICRLADKIIDVYKRQPYFCWP